MPLYRATMTWGGFSGAPGYTTLHFLDPDPISQAGIDETAARNHTFWAAVAPQFPTGVSVTFPQVLEEIDSATGELLSELAFPGGTAVNGSAGGTYHSASGCCITWHTIGIINGRRIRGRTFLVPLGSQAFDANGTLADADRLLIADAANALADATTGIDLAVWHRPTSGGSDGAAAGVTTATVNDKGAVLRSRRD